MPHPYIAIFIASLVSFVLGIVFHGKVLAAGRDAKGAAQKLEYKAEQSAQKLEQDLRRKL